MADDDDEKPGETSGSTGATSVVSKIGPNEQAEAHGCLSIQTTEPIAEPIDRPTSPSAALPQHLHKRIVSEDDDGAAVIANPPSVITPPLSPQSQAQNTALEEQEWEITKIDGKRRVGRGYESNPPPLGPGRHEVKSCRCSQPRKE